MPIAFMLLNVDLGEEDVVLKQTRKVNGVKEAHRIYGIYDMVVKIDSDVTEEMKNIITGEIRRIQGVRSTLTLVSVQ